MTSKEILQHIKNAPSFKGGDNRYMSTLNSATQYDADIKQIERDLEILEQIKVKIDEEIKRQEKVIIEYDNYAWKTQQLNTEYLIAFNIKNALEKIKEELDNEIN